MKKDFSEIKSTLNSLDGQKILNFLIEEFLFNGDYANCTTEQLHYLAGQRDLILVLRNIANAELKIT